MKNILTTTTVCAMMLAPLSATAAECTNATLNRIMTNGKLTVGVKADYRPFGFRETDGSIVGLEADLAQDVADTLAVDLELVPVQASNRIQFLEQGRIDLMIATMSDQPDRRAIVGIPQPSYYSSGTNAIVPKAVGVTQWSDLSDRPVCGVQGSFYNKLVEDRYGVQIVAFGSATEAKQALLDKKCVGFVYDDASLSGILAEDGWSDFEMPLPTEDAAPWGVAVPLADLNCSWGRLVSGVVYSWHQNGTLVDLEQKWGIQPTVYVQSQHEKFADPQAQ